MKRIKKIIFVIITLFLIILFAFNFYNFFCIKVLKHDIATVNGYAVLEVVSGSMEPSIHVGDLIVIDTKNENYEENDIVTFRDTNGSFVTHRIVAINDDNKMVTQGDNNNTVDPEISMDNIVGKYVLRINGAGKVLNAFKSPFVMIMILIIGVMVCVFTSLDRDGNIIIDEEDRDFQDYLKNKEEGKDIKEIIADYQKHKTAIKKNKKKNIRNVPKKKKKKSAKKHK